jgi:predicted CxxxxCH...CXXCH cytochrome family protein
MKRADAVLCAFLAAMLGCVGSEQNSKPQPTAISSARASCNECHGFPGADRCKTDSVWTGGAAHTQCYACHLGSIRYDSTYVSAESAYLYYDAQFLRGNNTFPLTDSLHGNGSKTTIFARCTYCHEYPPPKGQHEYHVLFEKKQCYECHFASVMSDTVKPGQMGNGVPLFWQRSHTVPGGGSLPFMKSEKHMNGRIDVVFKEKYLSVPIVDSVFRWNPADHSCSNVECHSGTENGGASTERAVWKEITR